MESQGETSEREQIERETDEREAVTPAAERDTTDEWRIEPSRSIATVAELEERIDVAVVTARSAEEAALEIGAASLEAAEQARHAASLAERASAAAEQAATEAKAAAESSARARADAATRPAEPPLGAGQPRPSRSARDFMPRPNGLDPRRADPFEERITAFRLRAEKVMIRLQKLEAGAAPGAGPAEVVRLRQGPPVA
ncbi:MAG TPA: hypothetical protein VHB53_00885 [Solirubrobacterales bacterium]|nr:hypothetical protein [Solirubrobacterales bacterium]